MSSDWQPPRTPLFGIALIPPPAPKPRREPVRDVPATEAPSAPARAGLAPASGAGGGPGDLAVRVSVACSGGWTALAVSPAAPVSIAVVAEADTDLWPERWLHPAERRLIAALAPAARRPALRLLTAARRVLVESLALPVPAAAAVDLSPLLEGVQSLRLGDWTLQRIPAPHGCSVAAAASGSGWSYFLLPVPSGDTQGWDERPGWKSP
ncbi:MAG: hypothetical protein ACOYX1_05950 [Acidobacteriota bacterium]